MRVHAISAAQRVKRTHPRVGGRGSCGGPPGAAHRQLKDLPRQVNNWDSPEADTGCASRTGEELDIFARGPRLKTTMEICHRSIIQNEWVPFFIIIMLRLYNAVVNVWQVEIKGEENLDECLKWEGMLVHVAWSYTLSRYSSHLRKLRLKNSLLNKSICTCRLMTQEQPVSSCCINSASGSFLVKRSPRVAKLKYY